MFERLISAWPPLAFWPDTERLTSALRSATPGLLFGLRLWAAVCLALYIAFWLELDNAFWAGTSAVVVCQPNLGASLRKGWFRMIGTVVGAVMAVVLTAFFVQDRFFFLFSLAFWGATCCFVATLLRNFAAYAAALAGYTTAIIASDELGAVGGASGDVFILAVTRASEICIGIISAGVVLAGTDFGSTRRGLASKFGELSAEIAGKLSATFLLAGPEQSQTRPVRRDLIRRVIALDPVIDQALGEASDLRANSPTLYAAVGGLFAALSHWRTAAAHLELHKEGGPEAETVYRSIPEELRQGEATDWTADPLRMRRACTAALRALAALPSRTPSLRLLADQTAGALAGLRQALDGMLLLADPSRTIRARRTARFHVPDVLPSLVNAGRAFVAIGAIELFWIITEWPSGAQAIAFAAIIIVLFSTKADQAYAATMGFMVGACLTTALAAIVAFAVLPSLTTFVGFSLAIGVVLVPVGALMIQPWRIALIFMAMAVGFVPLLGPANQMAYNTEQFYNVALAIIVGVGVAALAFRLLPPLSPALRTRRLMVLTIRDLRRLAIGAAPRISDDWQGRIYSRLSALPAEAEALQRAQLTAALSIGHNIIRLRHVAHRFGQSVELDAVLDAIARGHSAIAIECLSQIDRNLAAIPDSKPGSWTRLRVRGAILAMSEALAQHAAYFDSGAAK